MTQPRAYNQTTSFTDHTTTKPSDPQVGANLDTEFVEIKQNLDDLNTNIALLQRDDGKVKNESIHKDAFDQDALALIGLSGYEVRGSWASGTAYASGDIITINDATYVTQTAHTASSAFSTDTAKWTLLANAAISTSGHQVDVHNGIGTSTVQAATFSTGSTSITHNGSPTGTALAVGQYLTHAAFPVGTKISGLPDSTTITTDTASTAANTSGSGDTIDRGKVFNLTYTYSGVKDFQVYVANQLVKPTDYSISTPSSVCYIVFNSAPASGTDNVIIWGGAVAVEATKSQVTSYRDVTLDHRDTTIDYATRTGAVVRLFDGASGNVSDSSPAAQSGVYSAKEHAEGTFVPAGSAKSWASKDTTAVASSLFSAKEYATGVAPSTGGSAKDYAQYTGGGVRGETGDHSAKAWAVGGTGVTDTAGKGSARDWAIKAEDSTVDGTNYSALHYAAKTEADALATAADKVATNADVVSTNADVVTVQGIYDQFDDRYLGVKSSDPTQDNDGATLLDGALYFNTTNNVMMVYDLGNTTWRRTTPTTTDQGHINTVSGSIADVNRYAVEYKIAASAPSSPSEGHMWSDTTNNVFKVYNGTSWATVTEGQTEAEVNGSAISMAIALG